MPAKFVRNSLPYEQGSITQIGTCSGRLSENKCSKGTCWLHDRSEILTWTSQYTTWSLSHDATHFTHLTRRRGEPTPLRTKCPGAATATPLETGGHVKGSLWGKWLLKRLLAHLIFPPFPSLSISKAGTSSAAGLGIAAIVGILIVIFILLLVAVDVTCYFLNKCGLFMCIAVNLCGKSGPGAKGKDMEEGKAAFSWVTDGHSPRNPCVMSLSVPLGFCICCRRLLVHQALLKERGCWNIRRVLSIVADLGDQVLL